MSIFDLHDDNFLAGDKTPRNLKEGTLEYEHFRADAQGEEIFQEKRRSFSIPYFLCGLVFLIILTQLISLQITHGGFLRSLAEGNRLRSREILAPRGIIYDANDKILARNKATYDLEIYPLDLPRSSEEREAILVKLATISQVTLEEIRAKVLEKGLLTYDPIVLKENLDRESAMILATRTINLPGVILTKKPAREYLEIASLGPILGYVGKMTEKELKANPSYKPFYEIGKDGLEKTYEEYLKGTPGAFEIEVDSQGRQQRQLTSRAPSAGNNLTLSLNSDLQGKMFEALSSAISAAGSPGGAAVALNPQTGQVLGMSSFPTYDNNLFGKINAQEEYQKLLDDPSKPMFERALAGTYPSGSIIKPFVASAGLQEGIITENTTINAPGEIVVGNWVYPDWKVHGLTDVRKAIAESVNVFFYAVAGGWDKIKGLGIEKMKEYLLKFGFGAPTGIDLPGEAGGLVPDPEWKEQNKKEIWYLGDTYHLGIGQGDFLVTPLQMATAFSAIANGGRLLKPQLMAKITSQDGQIIKDFTPSLIREKFISEENIQVVRQGMRQAVTSGSARALADLEVTVAAKTGTAQFGDEGKTHAWMAAFAPYDDPEIVVVVLIEQGGEGHATAGPVAKNILDWYFSR